jgi:phage/plasmid primase-like uncharacterized protein
MTAEDTFREEIRKILGWAPSIVIADGTRRRFPTSNKKNDDCGWYILYGDGLPAGAFGDWRGTGEKYKWHMNGAGPKPSPADRKRFDATKAKRAKEEDEWCAQAAVIAKRDWESAKPAEMDHRYLREKCVMPHGIRERNGLLIVPVLIGGVITSYQKISADGEKLFLPGGRVQGGYFVIGELGETIVICESYGTSSTIFEVFGLPVIIAFGAGNLEAVAKEIRRKYPDALIVIAADDDYATCKRIGYNPGIEKGRAAAEAIGAVFVAPPFDRAQDTESSDWNDHAKTCGPDVAKAAFEKACRAAPEPTPEAEGKPKAGNGHDREAPAPEPAEDSNIIDLETERLARLRPADYERERSKVAKKLGFRASVLDKEVAKRRPANAEVSGLLVNQFGKALSCMSNCVTLLDAEKQRFSFNAMQFTQELDGRPLQDGDVLATNFDLENKAGVPFREGHIRQAVSFLCNQRSYHPVLDYVRKIEWDGVDRVDTFMEAYCKTEESAYAKALGKVLLIGAIYRMEHPGENFRYVPIWIGGQLIGKSTALHNLFGDWHFTTNTDFGSERLKHEIQGKWCCEIGDLHAFLRSDLDAMKNFVSATSDHFRAPYGHFYIDAKRCLIIVATANRATCLKDDTGETRFLPIECGINGQVVDVDSILRDRDQLWGEAYYRRGESVWLEGDAAAQAVEHQNAAKEPDVWEDAVATYLYRAVPEMLTPENLFLSALKFDVIAKVSARDQTRLGSVMSRLGYFRPDRRPGKPYRRKDGAENNEADNKNNQADNKNNEGGLNQPTSFL